MGGPVYHYDAATRRRRKFPAYWDGKAFFGEFSQDYLAAFTVDRPDGPVDQDRALPPQQRAAGRAATPIRDSPMDLEFGPDGSLYVLEYGDGFFRANPTPACTGSTTPGQQGAAGRRSRPTPSSAAPRR